MLSEMIQITPSQGSRFPAHLARPSGNEGPGVIMLNETLGITPRIKKIATEFAENGYLVCTPNLSRRPHAYFLPISTKGADLQQAQNHSTKFDQEHGFRDIESLVETLKAHSYCNGKIATAGFSMGGTLAFLTAARLEPDAAVAYYPPQIHDHLDKGKYITCQTVLHMGKNDTNISTENNQKIHASLIGKFNIAIYRYDAGHTFANPDNLANYNIQAANLAHKRTFDVLNALK